MKISHSVKKVPPKNQTSPHLIKKIKLPLLQLSMVPNLLVTKRNAELMGPCLDSRAAHLRPRLTMLRSIKMVLSTERKMGLLVLRLIKTSCQRIFLQVLSFKYNILFYKTYLNFCINSVENSPMHQSPFIVSVMTDQFHLILSFSRHI